MLLSSRGAKPINPCVSPFHDLLSSRSSNTSAGILGPLPCSLLHCLPLAMCNPGSGITEACAPILFIHVGPQALHLPFLPAGGPSSPVSWVNGWPFMTIVKYPLCLTPAPSCPQVRSLHFPLAACRPISTRVLPTWAQSLAEQDLPLSHAGTTGEAQGTACSHSQHPDPMRLLPSSLPLLPLLQVPSNKAFRSFVPGAVTHQGPPTALWPQPPPTMQPTGPA